MNKIIAILLSVILSYSISAQDKKIIRPTVHKAVFYCKTPSLKDMSPPARKYYSAKEMWNILESDMPEILNPLPFLSDPVVQNFNGNGVPARVLISRHAMDNADFGVPPDTQGDVGPDHYFHSVNISFVILDKSGHKIYGPVPNMTLWQSFPFINTTHGDPITIYDHLADRWLTSVMASENSGPVYYELIAISETPDPLGPWFAYAFQLEGLPDYPKFGLWHNAYYWTGLMYDLVNNEMIGAAAFALERDKMILGDPEARMLRFQTQPSGGFFLEDPFSFLPSNLTGEPLDPSLPNYFMYFKDDTWGFPNDFLSIWECFVDWADTSNCSFSEVLQLPTEPFDANFDNFTYITQPGTDYKLQSLGNRLMNRLDFRHFSDYNVMVTNHSVDCDGTNHAGVRWYELRDYGSGWNIYQQGTYAPDENHRWMGSISIDNEGNIALGYSVSGDSTYPAVRATGRREGDTPGIMTIPEFSIMEGGGSQTNSSGRWGDYSCMSLDPIDQNTFWYVNEYYQTSNPYNWKSAIGGFYLVSDSGLHTIVEPDTIFFSSAQQMNEGIDLNIINPNSMNASILYNDPYGSFSGIDIDWFVNNPIPAPYFINAGDTFELNVVSVYSDNIMAGDYHYDTLLLVTSLDTHHVILAFADSLLVGDHYSNHEILQQLNIYPNPGTSKFNISFFLMQDEFVSICVYDNNGKLIEKLASGSLLKGEHRFIWDPGQSRAVQGLYLLQVHTANTAMTRKLVLME